VTLPTDLSDARALLDDRVLSATDLLAGVLAAVAEHDAEVRSMVTITTDLAFDQAAKADARLAAGERTPMLGIPVVLKDLIDVAGVATTAGSRVLAGNVPRKSSTVWSRLEAAGAVLVGKANTHEFAYGGTTEPTRNPADSTRIVGGSSGGPAAALAAGFCFGAVGSDTAGSIRIPANLCGVAGLKPSRGLVPADGVVPLSPSLDVVGPMARRVGDLGPLLRVLAALSGAGPGVRARTLRVGILRGTGAMSDAEAKALAAAEDAFARLGASLTDVELPGFTDAVLANFAVIGREATDVHRRWADRRDLYTDYVRERLAAAALVSDEDHTNALRAGGRLGSAVDVLLRRCDVLLLPGVPFAAPPAYDEQVLVAGEWEDRDTALCRNTAFANLTGHPALAVPAGLEGVLPVGVQLVGRIGSDLELVAVGSQLEEELPPALPAHLRP
jgi:aspartyl-tRNA(Asn)/glutamyl-tRNA(Gln) amidotransferase subunit A